MTDVGELYWQAIGRGGTCPTRAVAVRIEPPAELTKEQVRAWAHGPLTGVVAIDDDGVVTLDVDNLPAEHLRRGARALSGRGASRRPAAVAGTRAPQVLAEENRVRRGGQPRAPRARGSCSACGSGSRGLRALVALVFGDPRLPEARARAQGASSRASTSEKTRAPTCTRPSSAPSGASARSRTSTSPRRSWTLPTRASSSMVPFTAEKDGIAGMFGGTEQSFTCSSVCPRSRSRRRLRSTAAPDAAVRQRRRRAGHRSASTRSHVTRRRTPETFSEDVKAWKDCGLGAGRGARLLRAGEPSVADRDLHGRGRARGRSRSSARSRPEADGRCSLPIPVAIALAVLGVFMNRRSHEATSSTAPT